MSLRLRVAAMLILFVFGMGSAQALDLRIASWNIQNLGWNNDKDYAALGRIGSAFDFIAVQELMNEHGAQAFLSALEEASGAAWDVLYSHRIGRSTYREKYGFFFRTDAVEYVGEAVVYIDERDVFAREPFSARFRSRHTGEPFIAATLHVVYGDSRADRVPELHYLARYWDWLHEVHGDAPRILMGDFNVNPGFHAWEPLRAAGGRKLLQSGATTLSPQDGRYVNLYDNIIVSQNTPLPIRDAAILPFPSLLEVTHEQARARISDHAPVYVLVGDAALAFDGLTASAFAFTDTAPCIDLNHADERQLQSLPHIGPARARAIIAHREHRPFQRVSGLTRVPGLGPARVEDIRATGQLCALP